MVCGMTDTAFHNPTPSQRDATAEPPSAESAGPGGTSPTAPPIGAGFPGAGGPNPPSARPRSSGGKKATGARKVAERALAVAKLSTGRRSLLAAAAGLRADADVLDVTVASIEAESKILAALSKALELTEADALEAGVMATELAADRSALAPVWALVSSSSELAASPPQVPAKAGLALARAAQGIDKAVHTDLGSLAALLSR